MLAHIVEKKMELYNAAAEVNPWLIKPSSCDGLSMEVLTRGRSHSALGNHSLLQWIFAREVYIAT